jgi:hypothetical protein
VEITRSVYFTTTTDAVKSFQHQVLNAPLSNIPYWKRSSSRDIPGTTPRDNHQIAGLLRSYAIEIFAARFLEDPDCSFVDPNVDDNSDSVFRRCCWFGFCWSCPSYCRVAIAVCLQKQVSIRMNVYCTWKHLTFSSHSSTSLSSVELAA